MPLLFLRMPARRRLAKFSGHGEVLPVFPNAAGTMPESPVTAAMPSQRRAVMLKGYQHWGGHSWTPGVREVRRSSRRIRV
jgi:hypothetical protein